MVWVGSFCLLPVFAEAQTRFDGLRSGVEAVHSRTTLEADISAPKQSALNLANQSIARGEAELLAASQRLSEERQRLSAAQSELLTYRSQLLQLKQAAAANPIAGAALKREIASREGAISEVEASLLQKDLELQSAAGSVEAGYSRLNKGRAEYAAMSNIPNFTSVTLNGTTARFSLGWGTSFQTAVSPIHFGLELDGAPGTGEGLLVVPGKYDTRIKGGAVFGASVKMGIVPLQWLMPYVSAGVETQEFSVLRNNDRTRHQATGFRGGAGIEVSVTENNLIRFGYEKVFISDATFAGANVEFSRDVFKIGYIRRF
jgi:opacity protein-like surface antigen